MLFSLVHAVCFQELKKCQSDITVHLNHNLHAALEPESIFLASWTHITCFIRHTQIKIKL